MSVSKRLYVVGEWYKDFENLNELTCSDSKMRMFNYRDRFYYATLTFIKHESPTQTGYYLRSIDDAWHVGSKPLEALPTSVSNPNRLERLEDKLFGWMERLAKP